ncbi:copper resistance protein CopD [Psychrobacter sp. YP14]|jgi:putative copper export protein|uniref:Copper resistance protein CopD n=3 Tax=Psychrobacter TaxID=497 RepID=A0A844LZU8_9GAMM|nr:MULTISPECIES: CopD family protein [Psychrobacter]AWT48742.1 copper resistance protein CopD [Psychrobacter sp. YP14]MUG32043.1 copper resistance protein CopD [Psychrobacter sanguinis]UNK06085.1 CopD family protein [Psychrobacter sp. PraFG1]
MLNYLLIAHLLGATVWTGGHLILSLVILPQALRNKELGALMAFEAQFEKIGMPAFVLQALTGVAMIHKMLPDVSMWFDTRNDIGLLVSIKLTLLLLTLLVALHARFRVIPQLTAARLNFFALHIVAVTLLGVCFVIVGSLFRTGLG